MSQQALYDQLIELRLTAFLEALREQQANPQYTELTFEDRLALLTDHECTRRRENRIQRNIQAAAFPMQAAFEEIDFSPARSLDRRSILELGQCNWITSRHNILVLGPTGSGKSYIASAFGNVAARHGFTVRYQRTSRLLHALTLARADGSFTALLRSLAKTNLLIIDDWMRDPIITTRFHITTRLQLLLRDFKVYTHGRAIEQRGVRHESKNETHNPPRRAQTACQWTQAHRSDQCSGCEYDCG